MALPVTISGISTAVAPVGPFASNVEVAFTELGSDTAFGTTTSNVHKVGLPFLTVSANSITDIGFWLVKAGSPTDDVTATLYAATGGNAPTGSALGSVIIPNTSIFSTSTYTKVTFPSAVTVSSGARYVLTLERTGSLDPSNLFLVGTYSAGTAAETLVYYNGSTWANHISFPETAIVVGTTVSRYYFFGRDGSTATTLQAFKSTAPDTSWASVTTRTGFTTAILGLSAYQFAHLIHIAVMDGTASTSVGHKYTSFNTMNDTFLTTTETIAAAAAVTGQIAGAGAGASIVVRSTGEVVVFYSGLQTNTSGTPRSRVYYSRRTAVNTWAAAVRVDFNALARDHRSPLVGLGSTNRLHLLCSDGTAIAHRHLTAGNVLGTAGVAGTATATQPLDIVTYDDGSTRWFGVVSENGSSVIRFFDMDNPGFNFLAITMGTPVRLVDDSIIIYALYRSSADSDLYVKSSSDHGLTWSAATLAFTATVAGTNADLSKNQFAYRRGSSIVFPYIVNDGGTLKYNEQIIRTLTVGYTLTADVGAVTLAGVATDVRADRRMTAGTAMIAVAGPATGISKGYLLGSSAGAVTVTRYDANLLHKHFYTLPITVGAVTVAFNDANLVKFGAKTLIADAGAITFAGYAAGLRGGRGVLASKGSVTLAGQAATLRHTHVLTATTGAVALSGKVATLRHASIMPAAVGAVTLTGYAADLRKAGSLGMAANTGAVTVALQSATLRRTIKLPAVTDAVTLSGQATTLRYGQMLTAAKGAVTLAGQAATLRRTTVMPAATGAVTVTGVDATLRLRQFYRLLAAPGGIVVTGVPAALSTATHRTLAAATGAVALSGKAAILAHGWALPAASAPITVTGVAVDLTHVARVHYRISVAPGEFALYGQSANLLANVREKQPGPLVFGRRLVVIPGRW